MIGFCPLASGSRGNCIYLGTGETRLLIDAGLSGKAIKERLAQIGVAIEEIDAVLVSHEHHDHIQGLKVLSGRLSKPILTNQPTAYAIQGAMAKPPSFKLFSTGETFFFKDLEIHPFSIQHDAEDPVAFTIKFRDIKIGVCTDLGFATQVVKQHLKECDYLYVESNHEPSMVHACPRPHSYKQRVLSRTGHLSNTSCAELIESVYHQKLKHVYLAHLSSECNSSTKALQVVNAHLEKSQVKLSISVAAQETVSMPILFPELSYSA
jgi:phosphoribosyl 1,2-cyclic phosphodiesterase